MLARVDEERARFGTKFKGYTGTGIGISYLPVNHQPGVLIELGFALPCKRPAAWRF